MENTPVVNEQPTPALPSNGTTPTVPQGEGTPPAPGSKTESELLLKSLQEEREKRRKLEEEKKLLEEQLSLTTPPPSDDDVFSDEGKVLRKEIESLRESITTLSEDRELEQLYNQYPLLKEKSEEFKEYRRTEHPRAKIGSVAKLYLAEQGLLEPQRKGLENPSGGPRTPTPSGMTIEEIKKLRETDHKKYVDMLQKGLIRFDS